MKMYFSVGLALLCFVSYREMGCSRNLHCLPIVIQNFLGGAGV
jgi:hypothetical protein